jgi:hypothetical protein
MKWPALRKILVKSHPGAESTNQEKYYRRAWKDTRAALRALRTRFGLMRVEEFGTAEIDELIRTMKEWGLVRWTSGHTIERLVHRLFTVEERLEKGMVEYLAKKTVARWEKKKKRASAKRSTSDGAPGLGS